MYVRELHRRAIAAVRCPACHAAAGAGCLNLRTAAELPYVHKARANELYAVERVREDANQGRLF